MNRRLWHDDDLSASPEGEAIKNAELNAVVVTEVFLSGRLATGGSTVRFSTLIPGQLSEIPVCKTAQAPRWNFVMARQGRVLR